VLVSVIPVTGCNPHQYDPVPGVTGVKAADIAGTWHGWNRMGVTFQPDGKALVVRLDGQEFDFYEGWRMTGTGTWELTGAEVGWGDGQHVSLEVTHRDSWEEREEEEEFPVYPGDLRPAPDTYTWVLEMERNEKGLRLYFFFGDPDSRSTYYLEKTPVPR